MPLGLILCLSGTAKLLPKSKESFVWASDQMLNWAFFIILLVYPSTSSKIFRVSSLRHTCFTPAPHLRHPCATPAPSLRQPAPLTHLARPALRTAVFEVARRETPFARHALAAAQPSYLYPTHSCFDLYTSLARALLHRRSSAKTLMTAQDSSARTSRSIATEAPTLGTPGTQS